MMVLRSVWLNEDAVEVLYELLKERSNMPHVNISHRSMPSMEEHRAFVQSQPYEAWYLIEADDEYVGSIYLTRGNRAGFIGDEIGVHIFAAHRGKGYGPDAIKLLMAEHPRKRYLANINPANAESIRMFQRLGFEKLQVTYEYRP